MSGVDAERVFWTRGDDLPSGPVVIWRGDIVRGVREVEYVPADQLRGTVERIAQADRLLRAAYADAHSEDVPLEVLEWLNPDTPGGGSQ